MSCCRGTSDEVATGSDDARCVPPFSQLPVRRQWHPAGLSTREHVQHLPHPAVCCLAPPCRTAAARRVASVAAQSRWTSWQAGACTQVGLALSQMTKFGSAKFRTANAPRSRSRHVIDEG